MAMLMNCGHSIGYMYRLRDQDGVIRKFCFGCMLEKLEMVDQSGLSPVKTKRVLEKSEPTKKSTKTI